VPEPINLKVGDEIELTIESLAFGGKGVARTDDLVVFVKNALPQQTALCRITKKHRGYVEAVLLETVKASPSSVEAKCQHFPTCGGCTFQDFDYEGQIEQKKSQVVDIYRRIGHIPDVELVEVVSAENIFHYRNKMEFTFSNRRWVLPEEEEGADRSFALGLHVPGRYDKILDMEECWIQKPVGNDILRIVKETARERGLKPYDVVKHKGFLRNLVIRVGERTEEVMVNLVTSREEPDLLSPVVARLTKKVPQISSIVNNITRRKAGVSYGEWEVPLHGPPYIREKLGGYTFEISANSFFQTNSVQAEKLYGAALEFADFSGDEILYDLYCGTGSTSLFMSSHVGQVYGFELIPPAVEDAVRNGVCNGVTNCRFFESNLDKYFRVTPILKEIEKPDAVLLDPPRAGMHPKLVNDVARMKPRKIVYISCNPSTQARDVAVLTESGYGLERLAMVDMFPHTPHIETVALLLAS
jgi:23S rRNA (uracil1939-C5)-methyltransferase|tara:strand:- start:9911 stop:11323 length:1413 start_codon:yes stop_codon:yes gene_type:complete